MEHGVLRGNAPSPASLFALLGKPQWAGKTFKTSDPRAALAIQVSAARGSRLGRMLPGEANAVEVMLDRAQASCLVVNSAVGEPSSALWAVWRLLRSYFSANRVLSDAAADLSRRRFASVFSRI